MKIDKTIREFCLVNGTWFYVPGGFWERRRVATGAEAADLNREG